MASSGTTTLRISKKRKDIAESLVLEASLKCGKVIKVSEFLNFLLDRNLNHTTLDEFIEEWNKKSINVKKK